MDITFLVILGTAVVLYVTQWLRIEVTSLLVIVSLGLTGILAPEEALSGFSSPATLTVVSMLILSAGLQKAGVVDYVARQLSGSAGNSPRKILAVIALPVIGLSAFVNNTPVVALMIPVTLALARKGGVSPSKVLLPLSYLSILGGTCTLFGTSTNLLVDALYRESGGPGLGVFEFTSMGLVYLVVGALYVFLLAPKLLPERSGLGDLLAVQAPGHFVTEVILKEGSKYKGAALKDVFPANKDVKVLEVVRDEQPILKPAEDFTLAEGDIIFVESSAREIFKVFADPGLESGTAVADESRVSLHDVLAGEALENPRAILDVDPNSNREAKEQVAPVDLRIAEAVVTPNSYFVGRRVRALGLNRKYGVQVLAIRRLGRQHQYQLRELRLQPGDVLLVQGEPSSLRLLNEEGEMLLIEGVHKTLTFPQKAPVAIAILLGVVVLATLGVAPIEMLALAGVAALFMTRCIHARQAVRAVEPEVLLLLAGTIPLGIAMSKLGIDAKIAQSLVDIGGSYGPHALIAGLYVFTGLLTAFLSNSASSVLLVPIALGMAVELGVDEKPLLMAIAFGASASFATPIGYQTNTLVMGPGGYRFSDYLRVGLPMNIILAIAAAFLIPIFWPPL